MLPFVERIVVLLTRDPVLDIELRCARCLLRKLPCLIATSARNVICGSKRLRFAPGIPNRVYYGDLLLEGNIFELKNRSVNAEERGQWTERTLMAPAKISFSNVKLMSETFGGATARLTC